MWLLINAERNYLNHQQSRKKDLCLFHVIIYSPEIICGVGMNVTDFINKKMFACLNLKCLSFFFVG